MEPDLGDSKPDFATASTEAYPALLRAATVLCWSRSDVEDVVQETMLSAFKSYGSFRGQASFLTWSYTILLRSAQAANRRRTRQTLAQNPSTEPVECLPPVDHAIVLEEDARTVIDAIRALPERQREMVTLHFLKDLRYSEIADALGVSVGTVKATIFEAKSSLRTTLARKGIRKITAYVLP